MLNCKVFILWLDFLILNSFLVNLVFFNLDRLFNFIPQFAVNRLGQIWFAKFVIAGIGKLGAKKPKPFYFTNRTSRLELFVSDLEMKGRVLSNVLIKLKLYNKNFRLFLILMNSNQLIDPMLLHTWQNTKVTWLKKISKIIIFIGTGILLGSHCLKTILRWKMEKF